MVGRAGLRAGWAQATVSGRCQRQVCMASVDHAIIPRRECWQNAVVAQEVARRTAFTLPVSRGRAPRSGDIRTQMMTARPEQRQITRTSDAFTRDW
ncbi:hypothetical protein KCP69_03760 [Salmonella enterica subsp. enterica]|nr:hypothetical protein KCP69_03760 [Salmonella enterica subsp. enterica]